MLHALCAMRDVGRGLQSNGLKPTAFITTNYDLTIEHTWSNVFGRAIHSLHNREEEFPTAYRKLNGGQPFVFHIHGSIEAPRHIIFSQSSFDGLLKKDEYLQFLRHILMTRSLIFIGLSFDDPALKKFLSYAREKLSLICEQPSFACVERNELDLARTLQEAHVTSIFYERGKNHEELWNLIGEIYKETIKTTVSVPLEPPENEEIRKLRTNLAAVYVHYRIKSKHESAGESLYAGIIRTIGWERQSKCGKVTAIDLAEELRQVLHIEINKAQAIVSKSIQSLVKLGLINQEAGSLLFQPPDDSIHEDLDKVILSLRDRINVRYSTKIQIPDERIKEFLLISLVNDGVRLAHSILSRFPLTGAAVDAILDSSYKKVFGESKNKDGELLSRAAKSLLDSPNKEEAAILGSISRIAFLTDLILHEPDLKSYNVKSRPSAIYIDANFLLPAICLHHPRHIFYCHILEKARQSGMKAIVQEGFVEETISHRRLALEEFDKEFRGKRERFENYVYYYGTSHINVFLGDLQGGYQRAKPMNFQAF